MLDKAGTRDMAVESACVVLPSHQTEASRLKEYRNSPRKPLRHETNSPATAAAVSVPASGHPDR
ncbi:hypothetical protein SAMN05660748_4307 [Blastococcus aggregatus]|uniref:Uncharacterized protein n=1 Tax=Blastococcus aggregatus TaxID=38502 RepID=A0A285VKF1_9ACTN|nr:hypothetical protein SAMN05660748_4307 [Blastococcus aggregatus]